MVTASSVLARRDVTGEAMLLAIFAICCSALIGFAAHRASLCNVRAVAEVMFSGSAHMLWSLLQAVLWMTLLTGVLVLVFEVMPQPASTHSSLAWASAGGLLFGAGAAVNGGCSLSTLTRLADGDLGMLMTLAGFALGVTIWASLLAADWPSALTPVVSPWLRWPRLGPWMLAALAAWSMHRAWVFWRLSRVCYSIKAMLLAPAYHLSVSAAVIGLAAGMLYATQGAWSYTNYLRAEVLHMLGNVPQPSVWHGLLVLGLLGGMLVSALQRRLFRWRTPGSVVGWLRHGTGGTLMGMGAALVPGGNDTVLLGTLPTLTVAALCVYLAMLLGIAMVLGIARAVHLPMPGLACSASGCAEVAEPRTPDTGP